MFRLKLFTLHIFLLALISSAQAQLVRQVTADTVIGSGTLTAVAPSPDGKALLTGGSAGITLWDTATWQQKHFRLPESANTYSLDWSASGQQIVSLNNGTVHLWDVKSLGLIRSYDQEFFADTVRLSPGGKALAYVQGWQQRWVKVYNPRSSTPPVFAEGLFSFLQPKPEPMQPGAVHSYRLAGDSVLYLEFTSDTSLLTVSSSGVIQEAEFKLNASHVSLGTRTSSKLPVSGILKDVTFSADYSQVAGIDGDMLTVWSYPELKKLASRTLEDASSVVFSHDGKALSVVKSSGNGLRWEYRSGRVTPFGSRDSLMHTVFEVTLLGPREQVAVYSTVLNTLDLYQGTTALEIPPDLSEYGGQVFNFRLSSDETSVAVETRSGLEKRYQLSDGKLLATNEQPSEEFCSTGSYYYTADGRFKGIFPDQGRNQLILYEKTSCRLVATLSGVKEPTGGMVISPSRRYALFLDFGTAEVWDLEKGKRLFSPATTVYAPYYKKKMAAHAEGGAFAPDETRVVVLFGSKFVIFDLPTSRQIAEVSVEMLGKSSLDDIAFSPDGKRIAGSEGGDIVVWDYPAGPVRYELTGHTDTVHAISFLRGGKQLVTGSSDGTVRLWTLP